MKYFGGLAFAIGLTTLSAAAMSAKMPAVMVSPTNPIPACATPGRMMKFLANRNKNIQRHFDKLAMYYMRHGETLNIRWDYAFFQMMLETASLKFNGDVHWSQNNFAGLGATGGGVKGERFRSVSDGVRAQLEHLLVYAGVHVDNPVADRTRKVQSWKVLSKWQKSIRGPMTFRHIGKKWAPGARTYTRDIKFIADNFYQSHCNRPDPRPELVAEARGGSGTTQVATATTTRKASGALTRRASLGASAVYTNTTSQQDRAPSDVNVLNRTTSQSGQAKATSPVAGAASTLAAKFANPGLSTSKQPDDAQQSKQADAARSAPTGQSSGQYQTAAAPPASGIRAPEPKCRVWTASYGGQKAVIIKSSDASHVNYTVLDVNTNREQQETAAYISAYAKGGRKIGEFKSQTLALDKAFKLCPDG
ncbi:MAG: glucosaminidase domain-containing protein [Hyphomicrobiaceae bacterium]